MFDNISISDALPFSQEMKDLGLDLNNHNWQTKDLDNCLNQYFIQGSRLFDQRYKINEFVDGEPMGYFKREEPYLAPVYHHGEIYFYDFIRDVQDKWDCWVEFKAIFTNGDLDRYELVKFEKTDNAERKQRQKEWQEQIDRENSIWVNKYFFHTKPVKWFGRKIWYRVCTAISKFFNKISYKL